MKRTYKSVTLPVDATAVEFCGVIGEFVSTDLDPETKQSLAAGIMHAWAHMPAYCKNSAMAYFYLATGVKLSVELARISEIATRRVTVIIGK